MPLGYNLLFCLSSTSQKRHFLDNNKITYCSEIFYIPHKNIPNDKDSNHIDDIVMFDMKSLYTEIYLLNILVYLPEKAVDQSMILMEHLEDFQAKTHTSFCILHMRQYSSFFLLLSLAFFHINLLQTWLSTATPSTPSYNL